ncbi:MAG: SixA phosphatase family protein [Nitrospirales bacterium]
MKHLYLVRHAEACEQGANGRDFDRPLSANGKEDASQMGQRLSQWPKPEVMLSSSAIRAKTTANLLATAIEYPQSEIIFEEQIYEAELENLLSVIRAVYKEAVCVMLVGHNPALTQLVTMLGGGTAHMPTCSMALLQIPSNSWGDIDHMTAELINFDYPSKVAE